MTEQPAVAPVDQLRSGAFSLRNPFHLPSPCIVLDVDLAGPLANWLERTADEWESLSHLAADLNSNDPVQAAAAAALRRGPYDSQEALAVARLITQPRTVEDPW